MKTNPQIRNRVAAAAKLLMLAAFIVVISPQIARAQGGPTLEDLWMPEGTNIYSANSGFVGIGTTVPVYKLDVWSESRGVARFGNLNGRSEVLITAPTGFNANLSLLQGDTSQWLLANVATNDRFAIMQAGELEVFSILQDGKVGVGTATPGFLFDVQGGQLNASGGLCIAGVCKTAWSQTSQWTTAGANIHFTGGNVGIGTSAPGSPLEINSNQNAVVRLLALNNPSSGASAQSAVSFFEGATEKAKFGVNSSGAAGYVGGQNAFQIWNLSNAPMVFGTNGAERLRVSASGNVGIGTAAPGYRLDVQSGQINVSDGICMAGDCKSSWSQVAPWSTFGGNLSYSAGSVGIGTSSPGSLLEISKNQNAGTSVVVDNAYTSAGNSAYSGLMLKQSGVNRLLVASINDNNSTATAGPGAAQIWNFANAPMVFATNNLERMRLDAAGNLGIGTNSPTLPVEIRGNSVAFTSDARALIGNYDLTAMAQGVGGGIQFGGKYHTNGALAGFASISGIKENATNNDFSSALVFTTRAMPNTQTEKLRITSAGRVGIGTSAPTANLEISSGTAQFSPAVNIMASAHATSERAAMSFGMNAAGTVGWSFGQDRNGNGTRDMYLFDVSNNRDLMYWGSNGSVGIGNTTPSASYKLDVSGSVNAGGLCIGGDCKTAWSQVTSSTSAANVSAGQFGANVGGGNYSFPGNVDLSGTITWGNTNSRTDSKNDAGAQASKSGFFETATPTNYPAGASSWWHLIEARHSNNANNYALQIAGSFFDQNVYTRKTNNSGATAWSKFVLQDSSNNVSLPGSGVWSANGNVGIGTTGPTSKLDVVGNVNVSGVGSGNITASGTITGGTINAKYQDVAEWVESSQALPVGTVVVLDQSKSNQVVASSHSYDTSVAGVISAQPGITLGERSETKVLVATTGRVKVRVDASPGPIRIGDLLVTSDQAGVAKKSEPLSLGGVQIHRPGTLIGKALEPLAAGTGEILVLLSLQ